jgi:hypothetical protein
MPSNFANIRVGSNTQRLITAKLLQSGCESQSDAIKSLMKEGAGVTRPVIAKLAQPSNFKAFHLFSLELARDLATVKNRVTYARPKSDDKEYNDRLDRLEKITNDLLPRLEKYAEMADAMFLALTGLTWNNCKTLSKAYAETLRRMDVVKAKISAGKLSPELITEAKHMLDQYETFIKALSILGISSNEVG